MVIGENLLGMKLFEILFLKDVSFSFQTSIILNDEFKAADWFGHI